MARAKPKLDYYLQEVYNWQHAPDADWFTAQLFNLWMKADEDNKLKLKSAFPAEIGALDMWYSWPDPDSLFQIFGIANKEKGIEK